MTADLIALCRRQPDRDTVLAALEETASVVRPHPSGAVVELFDRDGRPLLAVDGPILVQVPGEVERLLGPGYGDAPVWWVEIRAASDRADLARRFAARLVAAAGGTVWP